MNCAVGSNREKDVYTRGEYDYIEGASLQTEWAKDSNGEEHKEVRGAKSIFHWCCGMRMTRILLIERVGSRVHRVQCSSFTYNNGWFCEVCNRRKLLHITIGL
jgi:hypothetical protein